MVEFTEEEKANYAERLRLRTELKERQEREAKEQETNSKVKPDKSDHKPGILERVANKTEAVRGKYNYQKEQAGRIKNAILPPKQKKQATVSSQHRASKLSRASRSAYRYPVARPARVDLAKDFIMGSQSPATKSSAQHINEMIGFSNAGKNNTDFMNSMIHGSSSGKGKKNKDFWREMLGK